MLYNSSGWIWPASWVSRLPLLSHIQPLVHDKPDVVWWKDHDGNRHDFSVRLAWDSIRQRAEKVPWVSVVCCIISIKDYDTANINKLKTQDHLRVWDTNVNGVGSVCPFCKSVPDSQVHLFFECNFSKRVWSKAKVLIPVQLPSDNWQQIVASLAPVAHRRAARVVVTKLVFAATVYFVWQERNARLFNGKARSEEMLFQMVYSTIRLKLMSLRFKDSVHVHRIKNTWKIS
ncbi:uncharacterized protein [Rutidosis leptorrhynchoides]|uniref:uncharacterized protein n=1 Tax=Rutidosis leptorrhynchoides TaxID=125765 RepID=UPI003A9A004B